MSEYFCDIRSECVGDGKQSHSVSIKAESMADLLRAIVIAWPELDPAGEDFRHDCLTLMWKHLMEDGEDSVKRELAEYRQKIGV